MSLSAALVTANSGLLAAQTGLRAVSDNIANVNSPDAPVHSEDERFAELGRMAQYFSRLWNERINAEPRFDLISMMAHSEATRNMAPREFVGTLALLIVGGNDTTRNSMTGGLLALASNSGEWAKLRARTRRLAARPSARATRS